MSENGIFAIFSLKIRNLESYASFRGILTDIFDNKEVFLGGLDYKINKMDEGGTIFLSVKGILWWIKCGKKGTIEIVAKLLMNDNYQRAEFP